MDLVGLEIINPYEGVYEFKVYKYDDEINLSDENLFVCDLKVVINKLESIYINKVDKQVEILALVRNLNLKLQCVSEEEIKEFILQEIWEEDLDLKKQNIEVMFIKARS
ncbi:hypothetical protein CHF27_003515 [Romboutsia maritimum]|uniref:Uncharacterized protein n=1 Tax=Romboutsia maritimum TaxID=2020948 RepID=A0A371IVD6_9FIRM|nr:hypothetical protein [Romboutsia maritimum]RDY24436.1 hypothetical protein CHF27_003515 [Romboutsia maritimum]